MKTHAIHWKSTVSGRIGTGTKLFEKEEAECLATTLDEDYGNANSSSISSAMSPAARCIAPGRDMKLAHTGMRISEGDWNIFLKHASATLDKFKVPQTERDEVVAFVLSTKADIVEA